MEELIEKIDNLKDVLNHNEKIEEFSKLKKKIEKDKELLELIKKYNTTQDENIKGKILSNEEFREYKRSETAVNLLILEINSELKKISDKGKCGK